MKLPSKAVLAKYQRELESDGYLTVNFAVGATVAIHRKRSNQPGWRVLTTKKGKLVNSREFHESATVEQMLGQGLALISDERRV